MAAPDTTVWSMDRHTRAKHAILRKYLDAWLPILLQRCECARVIDGFAGPGEYADGSIGSPLIALQALLEHSSPKVGDAIREGRVQLIFIEKDAARSQHLQGLLTQQARNSSYPSRLRPQIITGTFAEEMGKILDRMERDNTRGLRVPTFTFIDPFGFKHTPLSTIARLMRIPMCEVLVTFMYEEINRFLTVEKAAIARHYDELFGTPEWRQSLAGEPDPQERLRRLQNLYRRQLLTVGGIAYVRPFLMLNEHNAPDYLLFFGTNSLSGLEKMKYAMWKTDPTGAFQFSDFSNPYQPLLLSEPNDQDLQFLLSKSFKGKVVTVKEVEVYVITETPYVTYKQSALAPMEKDGRIRLVKCPPGRRKGSFPEHLLIEFL